jgi:hypothetical protein
MGATLLRSIADNFANAICADGRRVAHIATVLLTVARTRVVMIAAKYALSAHRSGVNHV